MRSNNVVKFRRAEQSFRVHKRSIATDAGYVRVHPIRNFPPKKAVVVVVAPLAGKKLGKISEICRGYNRDYPHSQYPPMFKSLGYGKVIRFVFSYPEITTSEYGRVQQEAASCARWAQAAFGIRAVILPIHGHIVARLRFEI